MSRGLRGLGSSGLGSPSSSSNPPSQNTGSETNIPLGFARPRQAGQPGNVFIPNATNVLNTPIRPGVSPQIPNINTFETTDQQPRHVRALASTRSTNPPELGRKTTSSITRNPSPTKRKPKLTPDEKAKLIEEKTRLINEQAVQYIHQNPGAKQKAVEGLSAERSDRGKKDLTSIEYARSFIDYEGNKDIYRENMLYAKSCVKTESLVKNMDIARSQKRHELLKKLPPGAQQIAIEHNLDREQVKSQLEMINMFNSKLPTQESSTIQSPPKQDNPDNTDDLDIIDY
jgi:hypothetical protein